MEPQEAWKAGSGLLDPKEDKQPRKSAIITRRANWIRGTGTQISNLILRNQANNPKHEIKMLEYPRKNCASREDTPAESWATFVGIWQPESGPRSAEVPRPARAKSNPPDRFHIRGCHGNAARTMGHTSKIWATTTTRYPMRDSESSPASSPISDCWMPPRLFMQQESQRKQVMKSLLPFPIQFWLLCPAQRENLYKCLLLIYSITKILDI